MKQEASRQGNDRIRTGRKNRREPLTWFLKCMRGDVYLGAYRRRELMHFETK
jgi:hypothetical protein